MSYEKYYSGGWQSGETGGTPITPAALNHMEQGIANLDSEKAPAGYGLGGSAKINSDESLDNIYGSGFYWWETAANTPFDWGYMIHIEGGESATQIARSVVYDYTATRKKTGWDTWSEWEWVNPPMALGTEYRTTERWDGRAVYTMLVYCGYLPEGDKKVDWGENGHCYPVRYAGVALANQNQDRKALPYAYGDNEIKLGITNWHILITATPGYSSQEAYVQVWYTKD